MATADAGALAAPDDDSEESVSDPAVVRGLPGHRTAGRISTHTIAGHVIVFVSTLRWGRRRAVFCALTAAVVFDFCFIPSEFSFHTTELPHLITLFAFVTVAIITSELASRARDAVLVERVPADAEAARAELDAVTRTTDVLLNRIAHELRSPLQRFWVAFRSCRRLSVILTRLAEALRSSDTARRSSPALWAIGSTCRECTWASSAFACRQPRF